MARVGVHGNHLSNQIAGRSVQFTQLASSFCNNDGSTSVKFRHFQRQIPSNIPDNRSPQHLLWEDQSAGGAAEGHLGRAGPIRRAAAGVGALSAVLEPCRGILQAGFWLETRVETPDPQLWEQALHLVLCSVQVEAVAVGVTGGLKRLALVVCDAVDFTAQILLTWKKHRQLLDFLKRTCKLGIDVGNVIRK
ncbi:hypothetical protein EYF80_030599 [Liparis tanakae]|uniref:Uncharacterized protein n=1 Tax=Liparis tanakae TaxID=230148 RepID=A0A4Z2H067_9TELE|nr:hypothetical protein EYF80_030599 [Liparis tanakae]